MGDRYKQSKYLFVYNNPNKYRVKCTLILSKKLTYKDKNKFKTSSNLHKTVSFEDNEVSRNNILHFDNDN